MSTETTPHIKVVKNSEIYFREFHLTKSLSGTNEVEYRFGEMLEYDRYTSLFKKSDDGATELGQILVEQIAATEGVVGGVLKKYSILIKIGEAFDPGYTYSIILRKIVECAFPKAIGKIIQVSTSIIKDSTPGSEDKEDEDYIEDDVAYKETQIIDKEVVEVKVEDRTINIEHLFKKKPKEVVQPKKHPPKVRKLKSRKAK